ncbi:MAG TPA: S41 family peptidase [Candidatus Polarisedimenticolaceae bacterium]
MRRLGIALAFLFATSAFPAEGYLRQPVLNGDTIVFAAEGDLWTASAKGGVARRLTVHPGFESFPAISPDGKWVAFTGAYDGNADAFVVPIAGGEPRRLTWHPAADLVVGWTPDGKFILVRSNREMPHGDPELFQIPAGGGDASKLPLGWAGRLAIEPSTGRWAFTRTVTENFTWKRYRGGTASDIWVGDPSKADFKNVTNFEGTDAFPMWHGGRVWFLSDKGGTANLWSMLPDGSDRKRQTDVAPWDVRTPSMAPDGRIAFVLAGDVHVFDPASGKQAKVAIDLPSDRVLARVRYSDAVRFMSGLDLSPDGERLAIVTRGEIFSVPVKKGVTLPVTRGSGARERAASFSHDGKSIVYVTDASREEEIRTIDAWGRGDAKTVKPPAEGSWHFAPAPSPDGKWIAYSDGTQTLWVIPAAGGAPVKVDRSNQAEIRGYAWSPDGRWLAYSKVEDNDYASIFVYDTTGAKVVRVTTATTNDHSPAWDPDGRYLYFLSDRFTNPIVGNVDWNNVDYRQTKPFAVALRRDVPNPFAELAGLPPKDDEKKKEEGKKKDEDKKKGDEAKKDEPPKPVAIDLDGIADRIVAFPVDRGYYVGMFATAKAVFWAALPPKGMAEQPGLFEEAGPEATLMIFDLEKKKAKPFMEGISDAVLAAKGGKIAIMKKPGEVFVVGADAPPAPDALGEAAVDLSGVVVELDPREEWAQIYHQAWREMRDFYWDPGMGGLDWKGIRDRYATLLPRLSIRDDLRDLIGEVIGELATSHTYTWGGDQGVEPRGVPTGLLGADLEREGTAFKVARIYRGDPADNVRSPLDEPGVGVKEGDYLLAVNHRPFEAGLPFEAHLEALAGKRVVLTVNAKPETAGSREVVVVPMPGDGGLRYADWVRRNREYVASKTGGKIGYLHVPDMWIDGLVRFNTWFYPQLDKEGLVVDIRWNGGGAVSQMLLERLRRKVVSFDRSRGGGISTYPARVLNGPFVVLTNEFAGSDGDIFPHSVQLEKLAPVIGMRSWGGVVGIRGDKPLVDGGMVTHPEFAWWDPKNGWGLENRGVIPDIVVPNLPQELAKGVDAQLDRGIAEVLALHAKNPPVKPAFGPVEHKGRESFRGEPK